MTENTYDHIIVGAGSAGCAVVGRLAEAGRKVLLLEAGSSERSWAIHFPAATSRIKTDKTNWRYEAVPDPSRPEVLDRWAAGRVLGGGSSINGMVWVRGNPHDYDQWAEAGATGWDYASVLPYFKRMETYENGGDPQFRGARGPQHVSRSRAPHVLTDAFIEAAEQAGHPYNDDYNGATQEGVSPGQNSQKMGLRWSSYRAYLGRASQRSNVTIETNAFVRRVLFDDKRAIGVEYKKAGKVCTAYSKSDVVLSAGALASPKVLMVSGVGPAAHLEERGVPLVADLPGVGQNLQEHLYVTMLYEVTERTFNQYFTPGRMIKAATDFVFKRTGPITAAFAHAVMFGRVGESGGVDYEVIFSPFGVGWEGDSEELAEAGATTSGHDTTSAKLLKTYAVMALPSIVHPQAGGGTITLRSGNPDDPPTITHELLSTPEDVAMLRNVVRIVREVMEAPAMKKYVTRELVPGDNIEADADWNDFFRTNAFRGEHPSCTCKMGSDSDPMAVLDPHLRVRGVENLRVADVSVMPNVISGNTNAPAIMIGDKCADLILGQRA